MAGSGAGWVSCCFKRWGLPLVAVGAVHCCLCPLFPGATVCWLLCGAEGCWCCVCYKETRWLGMHKQSGITAGNHRRHTRTISASPATQANNAARLFVTNNAARAINSNPPDQVHMHLTRTPLGPITLTRTPHTHRTASCATKAPATDTAAQYPQPAQQGPMQRPHTP